MNKKLILLPAILLLLTSCGANPITPSSSSEESVTSIIESVAENESTRKESTTEKDYLLDVDFDGIEDSIDPNVDSIENPVTITSVYDFLPTTVNRTYAMDFRWFVDKDQNAYHEEIAKIGSFFGVDGYGEMKVEFDGIESSKHELTNLTTFYETIGFTNVISDSTSNLNLENDLNDTSTYVFGSHCFKYNEAKYNVISAYICGTYGNKEWESNFDIGSEDESYTISTGEHPEWDNKKTSKGFYIAAKRCTEILKKYINDNHSDDETVILFLTGHSRGGAVSNIMGHLLRNEPYKKFVYTYAAPNTTCDNLLLEENIDPNIFNIINSEDIFPLIPFAQWGFHRYGTDKLMKFSETVPAIDFKNLTQLEYKYIDISEINIEALMITRDEIYKKSFVFQIELDDTTEGAQEVRKQYVDLLQKYGIGSNDYSFGEELILEDDYYFCEAKFSLTAIMKIAISLLNSEETPSFTDLLYLVLLFTPLNETITSFMGSEAMESPMEHGGIPHIGLTYNILLTY